MTDITAPPPAEPGGEEDEEARLIAYGTRDLPGMFDRMKRADAERERDALAQSNRRLREGLEQAASDFDLCAHKKRCLSCRASAVEARAALKDNGHG